MTNTLSAAVAAGYITEEAAFLGLSPGQVDAVAAFDPETQLLVRFRKADRDGRGVFPARIVAAFTPERFCWGGFGFWDIRDVQGVAVADAVAK